MRFVQQKSKFVIKARRDKSIKLHSDLFPNSIRGIICGPSGCGKTVVLYNLIVHKNGLKFSNIYVISQSLEQEKYRNLTEIFDYTKDEVGLVTHPTCKITPNDVEKDSIVIFDDIKRDKDCDKNIEQFYSMGRHKGLNCFYLCQTYSKIPKQLVRDNANFIILFKQDDMNLRHVYNNHVGSDVGFDQFKQMCNFCWKEDYGFLTIDKQSPLTKGRYRLMFDKYLQI